MLCHLEDVILHSQFPLLILLILIEVYFLLRVMGVLSSSQKLHPHSKVTLSNVKGSANKKRTKALSLIHSPCTDFSQPLSSFKLQSQVTLCGLDTLRLGSTESTLACKAQGVILRPSALRLGHPWALVPARAVPWRLLSHTRCLFHRDFSGGATLPGQPCPSPFPELAKGYHQVTGLWRQLWWLTRVWLHLAHWRPAA